MEFLSSNSSICTITHWLLHVLRIYFGIDEAVKEWRDEGCLCSLSFIPTLKKNLGMERKKRWSQESLSFYLSNRICKDLAWNCVYIQLIKSILTWELILLKYIAMISVAFSIKLTENKTSKHKLLGAFPWHLCSWISSIQTSLDFDQKLQSLWSLKFSWITQKEADIMYY